MRASHVCPIFLASHRAEMEESQLAKNGRMYLERRPTILLGMSPGNPFFYVNQNLEKQFEFARSKTHHKVGISRFKLECFKVVILSL